MVKDVSSIISSDVSNKSKIDPIEISKKLILRDINGIRSNLQLKDKTDPKEKIPFAPMNPTDKALLTLVFPKDFGHLMDKSIAQSYCRNLPSDDLEIIRKRARDMGCYSE